MEDNDDSLKQPLNPKRKPEDASSSQEIHEAEDGDMTLPQTQGDDGTPPVPVEPQQQHGFRDTTPEASSTPTSNVGSASAPESPTQASQSGEGSITFETTDLWGFIGIRDPPVNGNLDLAGNPYLPQDINWDGLHMGMVDSGFGRNMKFFDRSGTTFKEICFKKGTKVPHTEITKGHADGHGTQCAFVLAGNLCRGAKFGHLKEGDARGGSMGAQVTLFNASDGRVYTTEAAMKEAAASEVDFLSLSITIKTSEDDHVFSDPISIHSFSAMLRGIFVCAACGNHGYNLMRNEAPWMTCVNACNSPMKMVTELHFGDSTTNHVIYGYSYNIDETKTCELVLERDARARNRKRKRMILEEEVKGVQDWTLIEEVVRGKIVIYDYVTDGKAAKEANAAGIIIINDKEDPYIWTRFNTPAVCVSRSDGQRILDYVRNHQGATAVIHTSELMVDEDYPTLASFCSRIPSPWSKFIPKPDLFMVGLNILTADLNKRGGEKRRKCNNGQSFTIQSGTSIATPAFCCLAGYLKTIRPYWNSSMIRSAFMTTADPPKVEDDTEILAVGSGVPNLEKAHRPILVYNIKRKEYCALVQSMPGCNPKLRNISKKFHEATEPLEPWNLNYPAFRATFPTDHEEGEFVFHRRLMFVDIDAAPTEFEFTPVYFYGCSGFTMRVVPDVLTFSKYGSEVPYMLIVRVNKWNKRNFLHGSLRWVSKGFSVRSPITLLREPGPFHSFRRLKKG